ncbi:hypothetical protein LBMAG41_13280 [Cyanobium sp.]|nr:hypothetical protein LBMAG41_13280 [Cyanobium sp.]
MYLSNAEKEALFLTGYGDVPPWAVQQGLNQALARGTYVPGEEALRLRLRDALDLDGRLAAQVEDDAFAEGFQQGLVEGIEAAQKVAAIEEAGLTAEQIADYLAFPGAYEGHPDDHERMQLLRQLHDAKPTTEGQEASEEPPADQWRSPLEIVTEGAEEPEQEPPGEEAVAPTAGAAELAALPHLCSNCIMEPPEECESFNIVWGVDIDSSAEGADADKVVACDGHDPAFEEAATEGQEAAPAAVAQQIEDRDFSSFTKAQLLTFAADHFGVQLKLADSKDELIAQVQRLVDEANNKAV